MTVFIELREKIKAFYARYDIYILPVVKFALAMVIFIGINNMLGYLTILNNLFVVAVLLIKTIVALKSKPVFLSQTQLYASELKMPAPDSNLIKKKRAKAGKSKLTSTHPSRQIRRPAYPRYRISRLKGTKRQSRPCYRKMTLYTYLRVKKRRMISRFSKANSQPPTKMPAVL